MGVGIVEWRSAIGTFTHPKSWRGVSIPEYTPFSDWTACNEFAYRLAACIFVIGCITIVASVIVNSPDKLLDWLVASGRITTSLSREFEFGEFVSSSDKFAPLVVRVTSPEIATEHQATPKFAQSLIDMAVGSASNPFVNRLLQLAGDVELNPGPETRQATLTRTGELRSASSNDESMMDMLKDIQNNMRDLKGDMKTLNKKFEKMETKLNKVEEAIDDVKQTAEGNKEKLTKIDGLEEDIARIEAELKHLRSAKAEMEDRSKRNNVIFRGVKEDENETWEETEQKVKTLITEKMNITENIEFERVHRMKTGTRTNRPIVAMCCKFKDKEKILSKGTELRGTNIYVDEHFSGETSFIRKKLFGKRKELVNKKVRAFVNYKKLVAYENGVKVFYIYDESTDSVVREDRVR